MALGRRPLAIQSLRSRRARNSPLPREQHGDMIAGGRIRRFLVWLNQPLDPSASIGARILRFACTFAGIIGVFDVLVIISLLVGGRYQSCGRSPQSGTCDYLFLAVSYPVGAFLTGAVIGATYSARRHLWMAIPAMTVAMVPWFTAIALADVRSRAHWANADTVLVFACSAFMGSGLGYVLWRRRNNS
jgi:hypothetical protein